MIEFYKETGVTPLEFINNVKKQYLDSKICYTARLDPMARGIVPVLFDEECKNMHMYTKLNKTYEVMVIIGYKTDTDDVMGLLEHNTPETALQPYINFEEIVSKYNSYFEIDNDTHDSIINQKFHYYSTKSLSARSKNNYENFYHNVKLFSSHIIDSGELDFTEWVNECCYIIDKVDKTKNFRQKEIIEQWQSMLPNFTNKIEKEIEIEIEKEKKLEYIKLQLHVGSGFFVRQHIRDISDKIGIPLMCYDINRISIDYI